jgi:hypothetical protein
MERKINGEEKEEKRREEEVRGTGMERKRNADEEK